MYIYKIKEMADIRQCLKFQGKLRASDRIGVACYM